MTQIIYLILIGAISLWIGSVLGYYARQSIVKKRRGTIEAKLQRKIEQTKKEAEEIIAKAKEKAGSIISKVQEETAERKKELLKIERILYKRERSLDKKISELEQEKRRFLRKIQEIRRAKDEISKEKKELQKKLERISGLAKDEAKKELIKRVEQEAKKDLLERIQKLNLEGEERFKERAKKILAQAIQRYALSQAQELTITQVPLPSEDMKGRIIGKEGRNIRTFEKLTGVELIIDDTPDIVLISGFNPLRRHIAKIALERLIKDGRIQPARIEQEIERAKKEVEEEIKELGEKAAYEAGVLDLPLSLIKLLGKLYFRGSYGQNVLLHSIEVSLLAGALADEIGANVSLAKKAGLLHDIGKAVDQEIEGSHIEIGIKILEKYGLAKEVIDAMKSHHGDYEPENIEAILVQTADQISGARPGARKDSLENYLKRLKELEDIAISFSGVEKAYAVHAGREIRVFVKPEEIGDLEAYKLARDIAKKIQQECSYPGEIKINVIRETRVIEYAK